MPGDGEEQGSLACCSPWGREELDMTWQLNNLMDLRIIILIKNRQNKFILYDSIYIIFWKI